MLSLLRPRAVRPGDTELNARCKQGLVLLALPAASAASTCAVVREEVASSVSAFVASSGGEGVRRCWTHLQQCR
jgi:hypothetical protein